ncbi:hypothetical protein HMF8227_02887 [Saliniradius amylolyticus]|uniref:Copper resistance protein B n=1 Tax=Saliniradius amylolyticus TaxID=2183582 RepID=A0A2S2E6Q2_9ALTE|nr:hypothetical protein [Saliniradius amylolyticus]AWL13335.1 hypothetical protein HMF8227_02887 [Saliniradius amylolyticus]
MRYAPLLLFSLGCVASLARADGFAVDKVYHPYVLANEMEVEWRFTSRQWDEGNVLNQQLGFGKAISDDFAVELYAIGNRDEHDDFSIDAYELEGRWMLTEQGQYWADWGMLFELERSHRDNEWRAASGLLMEKELGKNSLTLNLFLAYPWGDIADKELKTEFRAQYRCRWIPALQPAIEIYTGDDFVGIGPSLMGLWRYQGQKQLKYELGFITEVSHSGVGKDHTLRFALEWEF